MKSTIKLDSEHSKKLYKVLKPSLNSNGNTKYELEEATEQLEIITETKSFGSLRGATDSVFRLSLLANKIFKRKT